MSTAQFLAKNEYDVIAIVHRFFSEGKRKRGGFDKVLDYLAQKKKTILLIEHPLTALREGRNELDETIVSVIKGKTTREICRVSLHTGSNILNWGKEIIFNVKYIIQYAKKSPVFMVTDPLNGIAGILCKGKFSKMYYHCVDYSPSRFGNFVLDGFYKLLFVLNLMAFDILGIVSLRVKNLLEEKYSIAAEKIFYLPNSPVFKKVNVNKKKDNVLICTGGAILEKYAYEFILDLVAKLKKNFKNIKLYAVGGIDEDPKYVSKLKHKIKKLGLEKNVIFTGFLTPKDLEKLLLTAKIGLSFYGSNVLYYMRYGDPLKVREYALYGIPSITDGVTSVDEEMLQEKAGFVVNNLKEARKNIARLLNDATMYKTYQKHCLAWAKRLDKKKLLLDLYEKIFD